MAEKKLPFNRDELQKIIEQYPTPFHIYDEKAIRENVRKVKTAFAWAPAYKEYFAVKATPNPYVMKILREEGVGADCSSLAELILAEKVGLKGEDIILSSNVTPAVEYQKARELGAIINLDDISHIEYLEEHAGLPEMISFRYNPGPLRDGGNAIIGKPEDAKYGLTRAQILAAFRIVQKKGVKRFGLHTMVISNELDPNYYIETANMMFDLIVEIHQTLGIKVEFVNFGGGVGIPYRPEDEAVDINFLANGIRASYEKKIVANGLDPLRIATEWGRAITGPYGCLVATVL
ncbi:MAG TPA: diaminopimelate decarboxylase, partial [Patescibacteria group bacterium]|nr:diaminopimelate decarboxylase [Patescibacteria group bacterium]